MGVAGSKFDWFEKSGVQVASCCKDIATQKSYTSRYIAGCKIKCHLDASALHSASAGCVNGTCKRAPTAGFSLDDSFNEICSAIPHLSREG